jgi:hypothetical protein
MGFMRMLNKIMKVVKADRGPLVRRGIGCVKHSTPAGTPETGAYIGFKCSIFSWWLCSTGEVDLRAL